MSTSEHYDPAEADVDGVQNPSTSTDAAELQHQIEQTRAELGDTVAALAAKTDVKARGQEQVNVWVGQAQETLRSGVETAKQGLETARQTVAHTVNESGARLTEVAAGAAERGQQVSQQVQEKAAQWRPSEVSMADVRTTANHAVETARQRPRVVAGVVAALAVLMVMRGRRRSRRRKLRGLR